MTIRGTICASSAIARMAYAVARNNNPVSASRLVMGEISRHSRGMSLLARWINQAVVAMRTGVLPAHWIGKAQRA